MAVGQAAQGMLNANAKAGIARIFHVQHLSGSELAQIATWPDELKEALHNQGPLATNAEATAFNQNFPDNHLWHFVNLPLGTTAYDLNGQFSAQNDVVHTINRCIAILEAPQADPKFTRLDALRFLVHLVGDIHQPLHVGTGYYRFGPQNAPILVTNPAQALGLQDDVGANDLYYGNGQSAELHAYWDNDLVRMSVHSTDYNQVAAKIRQALANQAWTSTHALDLNTSGDYHNWAQAWATEAVGQAAGVYQGVTFGNAVFNSQHKLRRIQITLPQGYAGAQSARAATQLTYAGYHLGSLLNSIHWQ
jgi:hypothetical protein